MATPYDPEPDELDGLLASSSPATTTPDDELELELAGMIGEAQREARPAGIRRLPRSALVGLSAVILVAGAGTAAAATVDEWAPWAQTPDGSYSYTLPSGAVCEARLGNAEGETGVYEPVAEAVRDYLSNVDIMAVADVEGALADIRSSDQVQMPSGEPGGYGTEHYNADREYQQAVSLAVNEAIRHDMERRGLLYEFENSNFSYEGETHCPGAQW